MIKNKEWICSVCGKVVAPIFIRPDKDGNPIQYCGKHDPISREEFEEIWGITPDMKKPKSKRGSPIK